MLAAPSTTPVMWSVTSGNCTLLEDGCLTTLNFPDRHDGRSCEVSIDPEWTGVLFVEYMNPYYWDIFHVDGEPVPADFGQHSVHGMAPRSSLVWSPFSGSGRWKLCQVTAVPPWRVTQGDCHIDREGCFVTLDVIYDDCWTDSCIVEFPDDWAGSLNVVEAGFFPKSPYWYQLYDLDAHAMLTVNGQSHVLTSSTDVLLAGVHGMMATGSGFTWQKIGYGLCARVKICPMESLRLPGPWGEDPWTCTARGDNCTLPFVFNGVFFSACTQQLSDPYDFDQDGSLHNGHPQCQSSTGFSPCGPCSCAAGEEQTYNMSSIYSHTEAVGLVTCGPCEAGRFKSLGGSGTPDNCELCPPGTSSPSGATACTNCLPGMFNDYVILECASCQPGFFGFGFGLTMCQHCAVGSYSSTEQQTACDRCPEGSTLVAQDEGCQQCSPGTFRSTSMTACSSCDAGRFQNTSGQPGCTQCSALLDLQGPNPHLWTTMSRIGNVKWSEISGSRSIHDCGCAEGAWLDALGQCQECGAGIICKGMGAVEVLPGYFARADSSGFVWRCHGADWARCPGGRPGTSAQLRLNTSITCEECEPYTRMTNDGPCKA